MNQSDKDYLRNEILTYEAVLKYEIKKLREELQAHLAEHHSDERLKGIVDELRLNYENHHDEHHEYFAEHTHPDVLDQISIAVREHDFEISAHPPMRNTLRATLGR